jgi:hypothetical protein
MKKIVPIEKIIPNVLEVSPTEFAKVIKKAKSKGFIPVLNSFYEIIQENKKRRLKRKLETIPVSSSFYKIIQKNKNKELRGKPKGISNSFHKIFILAQLLNEKLSFRDLLIAMRRELGYKQPRGLRRHLEDLLKEGLIKKVNQSFTLPEINLEYLKKVHGKLVYNLKSEFEFYELFERLLPGEILEEWYKSRKQEFEDKLSKGEKKTWDFILETETDMLKGFISEIVMTKKLDTNFAKRKKEELEKLLKHPKITRKIKYKLEVLLDIYSFLSLCVGIKFKQVKFVQV